jgi:hypothetical protein
MCRGYWVGGERMRVKVGGMKETRRKTDAEAFLGLSAPPLFFSSPSSTKIKWLVLVISSVRLRCGIRRKLHCGNRQTVLRYVLHNFQWWKWCSLRVVVRGERGHFTTFDLTDNPKQRRIDLPDVLLHQTDTFATRYWNDEFHHHSCPHPRSPDSQDFGVSGGRTRKPNILMGNCKNDANLFYRLLNLNDLKLPYTVCIA